MTPVTANDHDAVLFDLDGVLTFDRVPARELLEGDLQRVLFESKRRGGAQQKPFDVERDYVAPSTARLATTASATS